MRGGRANQWLVRPPKQPLLSLYWLAWGWPPRWPQATRRDNLCIASGKPSWDSGPAVCNVGAHSDVVQNALEKRTPERARLSMFGVGAWRASRPPYTFTALTAWSSASKIRMLGREAAVPAEAAPDEDAEA